MSDHPKFVKGYASPLGTAFETFGKYLVRFVPQGVMPTQITLTAAGLALLAAPLLYLAGFNKWLLIPAAVGIALHLVLDYVDGALARARNLTSPQGFFLDAFSDASVSIAIFIALGLSSYASLEIMAFPAILHAMHLAIGLYWILLKNTWILPRFGDVELNGFLILLIGITFALDLQPMNLWGWTVFPFDLAVIVLAPLSFVELVASARSLFKELDGPQKPDATASRAEGRRSAS